MTTPALPRCALPLVGAAFGDALGSGVETGKSLARAIDEDVAAIGRRFWPYSGFKFLPGDVTDDTQMTLAAIAALRCARPDLSTHAGCTTYVARVGGAYRAWLGTEPLDAGALTRKSLGTASNLGGWLAWAGGTSAGNGSLMRATAPFSAGYRGDQLLAAAILDSTVTHADPLCVAACLWYSATLEAAFDFDDPARLATAMRQGLETLRATDVFAVLDPLASGATREWTIFQARWPDARAAVTRDVEGALAGEHIDCVATLGGPIEWPGGFVRDSLRQAAWAALQGDSADEPIRLAVLHGGSDTDTTAAIAGGLVGARFGLRALDHWSADLIAQARLRHAFPGVAPGPILDVIRAVMGLDLE